MVQVLPDVSRKSLGERFGQAIMGAGQAGGQGIAEHFSRKAEHEKLKKQQDQLSKITGIDFTDISDPKILEKGFEIALQQQGKEKLFGKKQDFLNQIISGGQGGQSQDMMGKEQQMGMAGEMTDEAILQAMLVDPNVGRALQAQREFQEKRREKSPEFQREQQLTKSQAQADVKYNQELQASEKQHELKSKTLDRLENLNRKGVTGKPYEKLLEKSGLVALTSEGRREFAADVKNLITDIRSILGSQFSQFEFQTILNAYPSPDFSKDANQAIINNLKEFQDIRKKEFEFSKDLKKRNGGKLPSDFQSQVNDMVQEYAA